MALDSWRDQLNAHADQLHQLAADIHGAHTDQAHAAVQAAGPAMMNQGVDPQRPDDDQEEQ
jgi:hypothetical protein